MGIQDQLDAINAADAAIRAILDATLIVVLRDLEGITDPENYVLSVMGYGSNGLYMTEHGGVILQCQTKDAWPDYGPQITVPMDVIDNDTLGEWIVAEKARRAAEAERDHQEAVKRAAEREAGRMRIFRGELT